MKAAFFCIPAHGHTNPMLPVAAELVRRGNTVRFYSFPEFEERIRAAGAQFVSCEPWLPPLTDREAAGLKKVSATEMTIQDIRITLRMDRFLEEEFKSFGPDVVYTDSVCFWGRLNALKHGVPMVVSTSTFAFNQLSSGYMKNSPGEVLGLVLGLPRIARELKTLEPSGYHVRNVLSLIQSGNDTDTVVYTSRRFQPFAESFSAHYAFVGPSVFSEAVPDKKKGRPLVYISLGTVINDRPDFYAKCICALKDEPVDILISCGYETDRAALEPVPENIRLLPRVDQLDVLSRADVFLTHCGMNSVSESLYMAAPMVLFPQTGEQRAVAKRTAELGAGLVLTDDSAEGIRAAVRKVLETPAYAEAAKECCRDFRSCPGASGAADFIENAPHSQDAPDPLKKLNRALGLFRLAYWCAVAAAGCLAGVLAGREYVWIAFAAGGILSGPVGKAAQKRLFRSLLQGTS